MKNKEIISSEITGIFPTPIYSSKLNRKFTEKELLFINNTKSNVHDNFGQNKTSIDQYILNNKIFNNLKKELNLRIKDYFNKIICSVNNITPYITQSWLNYTQANQYHREHRHQNSIISGVLYINSDQKFDKITFINEKYSMIMPEIENWNFWNAMTYWFPVETGDLILFPSSLLHMVENKEGINTRISLAFNVFIKGTIGKYEKSTELKL